MTNQERRKVAQRKLRAGKHRPALFIFRMIDGKWKRLRNKYDTMPFHLVNCYNGEGYIKCMWLDVGDVLDDIN